MFIKKDTVVQVTKSRGGCYIGIALEDFDTDKDEWYPLSLHQDKPVQGLSTTWFKGDKMPARKGLCELEIL